MGIVAELRPAVGARHGPLHCGPGRAKGNALVQAHNNVRAQALLVGDSPFRGKDMLAAVQMGTKADVAVVHPAQGAHTESLKAAAVGEDGAGPSHKAMQAAGPPDGGDAGAQVEVIGVAEDDLRAQAGHFLGSEGFDGGLGSDRHKGGGLDDAVGRGQQAGPGGAVLMAYLVGKGGGGHNRGIIADGRLSFPRNYRHSCLVLQSSFPPPFTVIPAIPLTVIPAARYRHPPTSPSFPQPLATVIPA